MNNNYKEFKKMGLDMFLYCIDKSDKEKKKLSNEEIDLLSKNNIYNVNIPLTCNGIRITRMGGPYYGDDFVEKEPNMFLPVGKPIFEKSGCEEIDTDAVLVYNYISITPLEVDRTKKAIFEELKELNK